MKYKIAGEHCLSSGATMRQVYITLINRLIGEKKPVAKRGRNRDIRSRELKSSIEMFSYLIVY
ncbi:hypothetical protein AGR7B_Lc170011 [Agrobacterium deltaense RV3]|nr:hypothetical protein AGR7B_Lc170011 [Agrobacterium deltaense RV3]